MSNHESSHVIPQVEVLASSKGWRLFRNSVGEAWVGKAAPVVGGGIMIKKPQRIKFGLKVGSSDLIGWAPIIVTPNMVGQKIAVFVSIECKTLSYKKTTEDQDNWLDNVAQAGGLAYIARETESGGVIIEEKGKK